MLVLLLPFVIGVILSYLMQNIAKKIGDKLKIDKGICAAVLVTVTYIVAISVLVLLIWGILNVISTYISNKEIINSITVVFEKLQLALTKITEKLPVGFNEKTSQMLTKIGENTMNEIAAFTSSLAAKTAKAIPSFLFSCIVTVVASFYIARDYDKLVKFLKGMLSENTTKNVSVIKEILVENVFKLVKGYLLILVVTFAELTIGFFVIGVKNPVVLAFFIAIVDVLPVIGVGTVLIPWSVIAFVTDNLTRGILVLLLYVIIVLVRNFVEPKIIGKKVGLNPLFMLVLIFVGLRVAGIGGMLLLPIVVIVILNFYKKQMVLERTNIKNLHSI